MTHGGKREGAGRPPLPYPRTRITVPLEHGKLLDVLGKALMDDDLKGNQLMDDLHEFSIMVKQHKAEAE